MKNLPSLYQAPRRAARSLTSMALALAAAGLAPAALAATDLHVWHTLNPHNQSVFEDLVKQYNRAQDKIRVRARSFADEAALEAALAKAGTRAERPQLVQLSDHRTPADLGGRTHLQPLHVLATHHPSLNAKWFLSSENTFLRDTRGRLQAFPFMVEVPVMYYNLESFKKAKLSPAVPDRSWSGLQDQLVTIANNGTRYCPLTSDQSVSINLENLAAVNNQFFASSDNGLNAKGVPSFSFDTTFIRHLSLMISWVRSELMVKPELDEQAVPRFAKGECAVLLSTSGNLGAFKGAKGLNFAVSGLPYYPQVTKTPGNPFVGGSALWVVAGHAKETDANTANFLSWLAQPKQASRWYQETGFLPVTKEAFSSTDNAYYRSLGDWRKLVAAYENNPGPMARGFRVNNYPRIRAMFHQQLKQALSGQLPAVTALSTASSEAGKLIKQR